MKIEITSKLFLVKTGFMYTEFMQRLDDMGSQLVLELYLLPPNTVTPFQFWKLVYGENHFTTPFLI